ncbi:ABC transporter substrate-binding protein [Agrobacterium cavarae]|uniref:ABC transporter substrate-binding protein n=1 Tax=Agrobacterium cavarae TaxID=2528239 RepID=UPI00289E02E8|nr:ABC transporter substrate-binding protein [Agrobacterium cavarae]
MTKISSVTAIKFNSGIKLAIAGLMVLEFSGDASANPTGDLVVLQWLTGSELDSFKRIEAAFSKSYPEVTVREVAVTWSGDPRGSLRASLMGGESADVMVNTWPTFRRELVDAGLLRPLNEVYTTKRWSEKIDPSWRDLGSIEGQMYGLTYTYGDRSGIWYRKQTLADSGIEAPPKDWNALIASFTKLRENNVTPMAVPGKFWAHAEIFETLLLRMQGTAFSKALANREVAWTDNRVKDILRKWRELIDAGCCANPAVMLSTDWDNAADQVLQQRSAAYVQLGMWINNRAFETYKLDGKADFGLFQFPAMGMGHDNASSLDSKEIVTLASGRNPEAADAFVDFMVGKEAATILAESGLSSPSKLVEPSIYPPAIQASNAFLAQSDVTFVLGDTLPGELTDEYRVQLQRFLQDTSDANIDAVTQALETKAASLN